MRLECYDESDQMYLAPGWLSERDGVIHLDLLSPDEAKWAGYEEPLA